MKIFYKTMLCLFLGLALSGCQKWLSVTPNDQFAAEDLFVRKEGFFKALNGIYTGMTSSKSYGQELSAGAIDVLARTYHISSSLHDYHTISTYQYTDAENRTIFEGIWKKNFELIANCNVLLDRIPQAPSAVLPEPYYSIVKGEALALRAFLHFDILRLFGPLWEQDAMDSPSLPYVSVSGNQVQPLISGEDYRQAVIEDLGASVTLLSDDPIRSQGVRHSDSPSGDSFLYYRQYRMNYFAVKALLCRAHLWAGEKSKTFELVEEFLKETQQTNQAIFPFTSGSAAVHTTLPDRLFSTEVIFSLFVNSRSDVYNALFSSSLAREKRLSFDMTGTSFDRVAALYDDQNDYRRRIWQIRTDNNLPALVNAKYEPIADAPGAHMIPLIRMSEMLLMAAETSASLEQGVAYLNQVRRNRNCIDLKPDSQDALFRAIVDEFRKETIAEGQLFFFYKRNRLESIPRADRLTGSAAMLLPNYVVPLPESETSIRIN
ncbi:RagB/SusD family nutrient uptake outer membrane protein [Sphingobacterium hotanense]|uniref:RagB/SusD family nutrient uptake outer membrane protein n=1 Tax=Sphingobacterium hotanense TaxID=649196 RepID=UPI0011F20723|nr:RagB/SusD family nutrient uptake outer membrane protein [Sphingobacterium hotanense]